MEADARCRACLRQGVDLQQIFYETEDSETSLCKVIEYVTGIKIEEDDGLPTGMCVHCVNIAWAAHRFKERYVQGHGALKKNNSIRGGEDDNHYMDVEMAELCEEPYQCAICSKRYPVSSHLQAHIRQVHKHMVPDNTAMVSVKSKKASLRSKIRLACSLCTKVITKKSYNRHFKRCQLTNGDKIMNKHDIKEEPESSDSDAPLAKIRRRDESGSENNHSVEDDHIRIEPETLLVEIDENCSRLPEKDSERVTCVECDESMTAKDYDIHLHEVHEKSSADGALKKELHENMNNADGESYVKSKTKKVSFTKKRNRSGVASYKESSDEEDIVSEMQFPCTLCGQQFFNAISLSIHVREHDDGSTEVHTCQTCKRDFQKLVHLENHMLTHSAESALAAANIVPFHHVLVPEAHHETGPKKKNKCKFCEKSFDMLCTLKDHLRIHTGEKPFVCPHCSRGFTQRTNLKEHVRRHQGSKPFQCEQCDRAFVSKGELNAHIRKHSGAHPFICSLCSGGFTTSSSLAKHMRIHTGERPYTCNFCSRKFTAIDTLKKHIRTHTGEKPYKCGHCEKAFAQKNDLVSHTRTHTGERPYACPVCSQRFRQNSALKTHYKVHGGAAKVLALEAAGLIKAVMLERESTQDPEGFPPIAAGDEVTSIAEVMAEE